MNRELLPYILVIFGFFFMYGGRGYGNFLDIVGIPWWIMKVIGLITLLAGIILFIRFIVRKKI